MSLITKQIDELRSYASTRKGELAKMINDAADTIEMLSAKLQASQMERSSQYYHDGWIPCDERMPEEEGHYLVTDESGGTAYVGSSQFLICDDGKFYWDFFDVTAWRPLPEPYRNGGTKA